MNEKDRIAKQIDMISNHWFKDQTANIYDHYYLFYRPTADSITGTFKPNGNTGDIVIRIGTPPGYKLASSKRINGSNTVQQIKAFITNTVNSLPILPFKQ